ncbi:phage tail protein I [Paracoccus homiensis]|uniref:phage tail protein I n=1 Tax=Paracoccus homiensis TaxID=364199 RepID=UPI00398C9036
MTNLLPHNASALELALASLGNRTEPLPQPIGDAMSPDRVPDVFLPWLAWALSVDSWDPAWSPERKRAVIAASVEVHRRKGTVRSLREALEAMGYGDARIIVDRDMPRLGFDLVLGGDWQFGDAWVLGPSDPHWADYWVELLDAVPARDAAAIAGRLASLAPARCRLREVRLVGVTYVLGDGLWVLGQDVTLGGVYSFGGNENG